MSKGEGAQTRERILDNAQSLFAARGFHGTSVDEIASHADVNKATIYYYFPSKQSILDQLMEGFLASFVEAASAILKKGDMEGFFSRAIGVSGGDKVFIRGEEGLGHIDGFLESWFESFMAFFKGNRDMLRIMLMESMMDGENQRLPFRLSDIVASGNNLFPELYKKLGLKKLNEETVILKFFGGLMPLALYAIYEDAWTAHYGMPAKALYQGMLTLFRIEIKGYFAYMTDAAGEA